MFPSCPRELQHLCSQYRTCFFTCSLSNVCNCGSRTSVDLLNSTKIQISPAVQLNLCNTEKSTELSKSTRHTDELQASRHLGLPPLQLPSPPPPTGHGCLHVLRRNLRNASAPGVVSQCPIYKLHGLFITHASTGEIMYRQWTFQCCFATALRTAPCTCVREVFGSDPGCGTGYPEIFRGLHQPWSDADSFRIPSKSLFTATAMQGPTRSFR
jgi:hypothetical protein